MATESLATPIESISEQSGSEHGLWIGDDVLTIAVDRDTISFPPDPKQCQRLNRTIQGLARAAKAVIFHAENDSTVNADFAMQPIDDIADAIILLSQISDAVQYEVNRPAKV